MSPSCTKTGPGRRHRQGNDKTPHPLGFADTYLAALATTRRESRQFKQKHPRDKRGMARTMVGRAQVFDWAHTDHNGLPIPLIERRVWLGGISAQRRY